jgi:hypothetical protein
MWRFAVCILTGWRQERSVVGRVEHGWNRSRKDIALHVLTAIAVLALMSYLIFAPSI